MSRVDEEYADGRWWLTDTVTGDRTSFTWHRRDVMWAQWRVYGRRLFDMDGSEFEDC